MWAFDPRQGPCTRRARSLPSRSQIFRLAWKASLLYARGTIKVADVASINEPLMVRHALPSPGSCRSVIAFDRLPPLLSTDQGRVSAAATPLPSVPFACHGAQDTMESLFNTATAESRCHSTNVGPLSALIKTLHDALLDVLRKYVKESVMKPELALSLTK